MRQVAVIVLHATAAGVMAWGWFSFLDQPIAKLIMTQKGGLFQYLTNQGVLLAWLYMTTSVFCDVLLSIPPVVLQLKKLLLMLSIPVGFTVAATYWPLLLFFPKLITPPMAVAMPPLGIDLAVHVMPFLSLTIDFLVFEPKLLKNDVDKVAPVVLITFSVLYGTFVEYCALLNGSFPYPFLIQNLPAGRILIYTASTGMGIGILRILNALHS